MALERQVQALSLRGCRSRRPSLLVWATDELWT
jgi:hypothetical protein